MSLYTQERLKELQAMTLDEKIEMSQDRIEDWYMQFQGNVYVSFSGGKDSTVLLHLVRSMFPEVPAVFYDTGLEYPELRQFVSQIPNCRMIRPKMTFVDVIRTYGYPIVSKEVAEAIYYARRDNNSCDVNIRRRLLTNNGGGTREVSSCQRNSPKKV